MPTPLLIGSCEPFSGKSAVVLGLTRQLGREGVSVVFGKPLATSAAEFPMDPEVRFVGTTLGLADDQLLPSLRVLEPATAHARLLAADLEAGDVLDDLRQRIGAEAQRLICAAPRCRPSPPGPRRSAAAGPPPAGAGRWRAAPAAGPPGPPPAAGHRCRGQSAPP